MRAVGQTAIIITVGYAIAVVLGSIVALVIWRSTGARAADEEQIERYSMREGAWLVVMLLLLFALLLGTIFYVPYGRTAGPDKQVVQVVAQQYFWDIEPDTVRADRDVEFLLDVAEGDVNHGFGIYDPDGTLVSQVQVIPDRTAKLVQNFEKVGTYEIRCLEFCGSGHHLMNSSFEVVP